MDLEANGFLEDEIVNGVIVTKAATKIYCVCITKVNGDEITRYTLTDYDQMRKFFTSSGIIIVGHNIIRYDVPVVEKLLGIKVGCRLIDTLPLSWYLYPNRVIHGLEAWGRDFSIEKPPILDWEGLPIEEYIYRCSEDVRINLALFREMLVYLKTLYGNGEEVDRFLHYIMFKMDCAREQEEVKWRLDEETCINNYKFLAEEKEKKRVQLAAVMPKVPKYKIRSKPKVTHCKDGSVSEHGRKWYSLLQEQELPEYHNGAIKLLDHYEEGNPNAPQQVKDWLFSLGWVPETFKYEKEYINGKQVQREIPQVMSDDDSGVCASIKKMFPKYPELKHLEDYSVLKHRVGLLKGFLRDVDLNGYLKAEISGLTNTLRFQHKTIVNLPQIPKKYWKEIRGCLIAPSSDHTLCGSDMSGLEDNTKQHYMYYFDPEYVKQLRTPGYDSHIDIAVRAKAMSYEEGECYKWYINKKEGKDYKYTPTAEFNVHDNSILKERIIFEEFINLSETEQIKTITILKPIRLKNKKGNFASVYGAGAPKLAITLSVPLSESKIFHTAYWIRNKAVKDVAASTIVKTINYQMWQYNPVSRFWYSLRANKDRFSTLNQGTGCYCFDTWVNRVRARGWKMCGQFHDEIIAPILKTQQEDLTRDLNIAIKETNEILKLNVPLRISIDYGARYSDIH